jgi:HEAT repeat protein
MRKFAIAFILFNFLAFNVYGLEEEHLTEAIEMMIIRETARGDDLYQKLIALEYIEDIITRERRSVYLNEIVLALEFLYLDAVENHRDIPNFTYIRLRAAILLGEIGTEEAKNVLIVILQNDYEEIVLVYALRALNKIRVNDNGEAIANIVLCFNRNYIIDGELNPNIALAAIDALGRVARQSKIILDPDAMAVLSFISLEARYERRVRERAKTEYEYWLFVINNN